MDDLGGPPLFLETPSCCFFGGLKARPAFLGCQGFTRGL